MRAALTERLKSFGPARRLATLVGAESRQARASATAGLVSIGLRALLLLAKFVFIVVLAKFTDPATVGVYALLVTIVSIAIYMIGLELHTFTGREIVGDQGDGEGAVHVQSHLITLFGVFLLSLPVIGGFILWIGLFGKFSLPLFAAVVFLEAIGQELGRYLLILARPVASSVLQFLRGAAWMVAPTIVLLVGYRGAVIDVILLSWLGGTLAACAFGFWRVRAFLRPLVRYRLDWLKRAFTSARFYFAVALLTQVQYYSDRFVVQYFLGESAVGVLSFYQNFASTMVGFVQTGVVSILLPHLLRAAQAGDVPAEAQIRRSMFLWAGAMAVGISLALAISMPFLLGQMKKTVYLDALPLFHVLLVGNVVLIFGIVVHLSLYARRRDAQLMQVALLVIPAGLVANIFVVPRFGIMGSAWSFLAVASLDLLAKSIVLRRSRPRDAKGVRDDD